MSLPSGRLFLIGTIFEIHKKLIQLRKIRLCINIDFYALLTQLAVEF